MEVPWSARDGPAANPVCCTFLTQIPGYICGKYSGSFYGDLVSLVTVPSVCVFLYKLVFVWCYLIMSTFVNNGNESRLVLSCVIHLLFSLERLSTSLDFRLLFTGAEA